MACVRASLRIEHAQRVGAQAMALGRRQRVLVLGQVLDQRGDVRRAARGIADRIEVQLDVLDARLAHEAQRELDQLGVDRRPGIADRLDIPLVELAVAAGLRPVVAEHRPESRQPNRLRQRMHAVFDEGAADARRRLGSECPAILVRAWRADPEELLLDDVRHLADAALEDCRVLEHRRLDRPVAVQLGQPTGNVRHVAVRGSVGREQVARPSRRLELGHVVILSPQAPPALLRVGS